jgi:ABC-type multidrug transport system fused ATPase/permease subunit
VLFNRAMALIAMVALPLDFALAAFYGTALRRAFIAERETSAAATTRIEETLASIKTVKAFGREDYETDRYARDNWTSFVAARRARMMLVRYRVLTNTVRGLAYVAAAYLGARMVLSGGRAGVVAAVASLGSFQASLSAFAWMTHGGRNLADRWGSLQDVSVAISRVLEMLNLPASERKKSGSAIPRPLSKSLAFSNVGFSYDSRTPVLENMSFEARAGDLIAIAGPSGAGKSTIVSLLLRFLDPGSGQILYDDVAIENFDLPAWRSMLSVALQENPLFTATIRDNILYSRPDASEDDLHIAIRRAGLVDFVRSLPAGLETMLGEKGAKLSAGQAQRIGLARALLRDAPILLLDEPTSALDGKTEQTVLDGIREWISNAPSRRLAIMVTHRPVGAARADRVYRLDNGQSVPDFDAASSQVNSQSD